MQNALFGEVVSVKPIPGSKLVKVRIALENQGGRKQCGVPARHLDAPLNPLEFTDDGTSSNSSASGTGAFT